MTRSRTQHPGYGVARDAMPRRRAPWAPALLLSAGMLAGGGSHAAVDTAALDRIERQEMSVAQRDAMLALMKRIDRRVETGYARYPGLRERMRESLRSIGDAPDAAERLRRARDYREKWRDDYGKVLEAAGVDIAALAADLRGIFPDMTVSVGDDYGVLGHLVQSASATPSPPPPFSQVVGLVADLRSFRTPECGDRGSAGTRDGRTHATSDGTLAGVCRMRAVRNAPDVRITGSGPGSVLLSGRLRSSAQAVGQIGAAASASLAAFQIACAGTRRQALVATLAFSPLGWVAGGERATPVVDLQIEGLAGESSGCGVHASAKATSLAVLSPATAGSAEFEITRALRVLQP